MNRWNSTVAVELERKGSWLIGKGQSWQMHSVHGPLKSNNEEREFFRVETSCADILLISRSMGERGMRNLRLDSIISAPVAAAPFTPPA